ncbi:MAG: hypothetical protein HPY66_1236 [Firmicutes bacterium]|nr:hypothetical protein [Bacillota bacterium]
MEKDAVYTGGGSENSLVRISPAEMQRINGDRCKDPQIATNH